MAGWWFCFILPSSVSHPFNPLPCLVISENVIIGNLVVKADPSFGGGELNISGACIVNGSY